MGFARKVAMPQNNTLIRVVLRTRTVGQCFGTVGEIRARDGDLLAEGQVRPYGFESAAISDVAAIASDRGYLVLTDPEQIEDAWPEAETP